MCWIHALDMCVGHIVGHVCWTLYNVCWVTTSHTCWACVLGNNLHMLGNMLQHVCWVTWGFVDEDVINRSSRIRELKFIVLLNTSVKTDNKPSLTRWCNACTPKKFSQTDKSKRTRSRARAKHSRITINLNVSGHNKQITDRTL